MKPTKPSRKNREGRWSVLDLVLLSQLALWIAAGAIGAWHEGGSSLHRKAEIAYRTSGSTVLAVQSAYAREAHR